MPALGHDRSLTGRWAPAAVLGALLAAPGARGESAQTDSAPSAPPIQLTACSADEAAAAFVAALRVESAGIEVPANLRAAIIDCAVAEGRVEMAVGERHVAIDVSDVPPLARPRTAAVAVAETLRWWPRGASSAASTRLPPDPAHELLATEAETASPPHPLPVDAIRDTRAEAAGAITEWDAMLSARLLVIGREQTLLTGADLRVGWRPLAALRTELGLGYLTTRDDFRLGHATVHGWAFNGALELAVGDAFRAPYGLSALLGCGLEGQRIVAVAQSAFGFDEPAQHAWLLLADVHATLVSSLHDHWVLLTSVAVSKDLVGVRLTAGGEHGFSLTGVGIGARIGIGRAL